MSAAKAQPASNVIPFRPRAVADRPEPSKAQGEPCIDIDAWYHAEAVQAQAPGKREAR